MDSDSLLLLEEPELSLNSGIVSTLAPLIYRMQRQRKRQVLITLQRNLIFKAQYIVDLFGLNTQHVVSLSLSCVVVISTHSESLLSDNGIDGREVLLLTPSVEGTLIEVAGNIADVKPLLEAGLSVGEVVLPRSRPAEVQQLELFK